MPFTLLRIARLLAISLREEEWSSSTLATKLSAALTGGRRKWEPLSRRILTAFPTANSCSAGDLSKFLVADATFAHRLEDSRVRMRVGGKIGDAKSGFARRLELPHLTTAAALAQWLGITENELIWLSGVRRDARGTHYRYHWTPKRRGDWRLLESPKSHLKSIQRELLHGVLDRVPTHYAAHGFVAGRSTLSAVAAHTAKPVVLKLDLRHFFNSIHGCRVTGLFLSLGYAEPVARLLAGLCTNSLPDGIQPPPSTAFRQLPDDWHQTLANLQQSHLPQGAPTSPSIANLCAYRMDCRLDRLAHVAGATYTRYADDLIFSGDDNFRRASNRFVVSAGSIILAEGFAFHARKTRIMLPSGRQQSLGIVVNAKPNIRRTDYDQIKATLHNCVRFGAAGQNRDGHANFRAHLRGRIAHIQRLNPARGQKLLNLFAKVDFHA